MSGELSLGQLLKLGEVINKGLGKSGSVIAEMTGLAMEIKAPRIEMVPLKDIAEIAGGPELVGIGLYQGITGDVDGHLLLFFSEANAYSLVDLLLEVPMGSTSAQGELGSLGYSALSELSNVTGSFFMNSLADVTGLEIIPSTPAVVLDMLGAILDNILAELSSSGNHALVAEAKFEGMSKGIQGCFLLLPTLETLEIILNRLEQKL
jgi:chemotaxis protein CheC